MSEKMNVLFIITDQQRADHLGCAVNPALKTPNLDRLASESVRFTNAYISNQVQVVLPGTGDRTLFMTMEDEMAIGFPAKKLFYIMKNLFKSAYKFNMGMPSKFMLIDLPDGMGPPAFRYLKRQHKRLKKGRFKKNKKE